MANYVPFQGGVGSEDATYGQSGGYLLPPEQGEILVNGILVETGAIQLAGDARATSARRTHFPIWLGQPDAAFVGEAAAKPLTGAALGQGTLNVKKVATIVVFTDEQIEDMMNGDLNVLVDAGVRQAISKVIDQNAVGTVASNFDSSLVGSGGTGVTIGTDTIANVDDRLQRAVSAAMGVLEGNGYGDPANMGVLLSFGWQQTLRDARDAYGRPIYDGGTFAGQSVDALYGLDRAHSTALVNQATAGVAVTTGGVSGTAAVATGNAGLVYPGAPIIETNGTVRGSITAVNSGTGVLTFSGGGTATTSDVIGQPKAIVVHKPNLHVRVRSDVSVATSNEASLPIPGGTPPYEGQGGGSTLSLFQNNLTAVRYETRLGFFIHDAARAVVPIWG